MISGKILNRCIDILSELNARAETKRDKNLILELGYIIKQELDLVKAWENNHNKQIAKNGKDQIDINKLLEDNAQLYRENNMLVKSISELKSMIEAKIPTIQEELSLINGKFDLLNNLY